MDTLADKNNAFALDLYKVLSKKPGNLFFSPFSISAALAMTYAGARGNTEKQMAQVMHFDADQSRFHPAFSAEMGKIQKAKSENVNFSIANSIFPDAGYPFLKAFIETLREHYSVEITPVSYSQPEAARKVINDWVEGKTEQKIKDLIPAGLLTRLVRLVLANAIYFKGNWNTQFKKDYTLEADFHVSAQKTARVPLMYQEEPFRYAHFDGMQFLEMPYVGETLSFLAILPDNAENLADLEAKLDIKTLRKLDQRLFAEKVRVFIPRFKLECSFLLNDALNALGMRDAFNSNKANFSGMDGTGELSISHVLHKAFVEVNEEGTEAAAATAVIARSKSMAPPPIIFRADHPFIFMIREKATGSILFLGRMENPVT